MKISYFVYAGVCLVAQLCPTLCDLMDCSLPGSSVHGDSPGKNTGVGCMPSSRGSSQPRDWTQVFRTAGGFFTVWATREAYADVVLVLYLKINGFFPYSHFLIITILIWPNCLGQSSVCFFISNEDFLCEGNFGWVLEDRLSI